MDGAAPGPSSSEQLWIGDPGHGGGRHRIHRYGMGKLICGLSFMVSSVVVFMPFLTCPATPLPPTPSSYLKFLLCHVSRAELVRVMSECMRGLGYGKAAAALEQEAGVGPTVTAVAPAGTSATSADGTAAVTQVRSHTRFYFNSNARSTVHLFCWRPLSDGRSHTEAYTTQTL